MDARELPWHRDPEIMAGELVFRGTRVLVASLFDTLGEGGSLEEFYEDFPSVPRESVRAALRLSGRLVDRVTDVLDSAALLDPAA